METEKLGKWSGLLAVSPNSSGTALRDTNLRKRSSKAYTSTERGSVVLSTDSQIPLEAYGSFDANYSHREAGTLSVPASHVQT